MKMLSSSDNSNDVQGLLSQIVGSTVPTLRQYLQYVLTLRGINNKSLNSRFCCIFINHEVDIKKPNIVDLLDKSLLIEDKKNATMDFNIHQFRQVRIRATAITAISTSISDVIFFFSFDSRLNYNHLIRDVITSLETIQAQRLANVRRCRVSGRSDTPWVSSSISILLSHEKCTKRRNTGDNPSSRTVQYLIRSLEWKYLSHVLGDQLTSHLLANTIILTAIQFPLLRIYQQVCGRLLTWKTTQDLEITRHRWRQSTRSGIDQDLTSSLENQLSATLEATQQDPTGNMITGNPLLRRRKKQNREIRRKESGVKRHAALSYRTQTQPTHSTFQSWLIWAVCKVPNLFKFQVLYIH